MNTPPVGRQRGGIEVAEYESQAARTGPSRQPTSGFEAGGAGDPGDSPRPRRLMCSCGASRNMPYCDGTHADIGNTSAR